MLSRTTGGQGTYTYQYNQMGLLAEVTDPAGNTSLRTYDLALNQVQATDPAGRVTIYTYDDADRLRSVTGPGPSPSTAMMRPAS